MFKKIKDRFQRSVLTKSEEIIVPAPHSSELSSEVEPSTRPTLVHRTDEGLKTYRLGPDQPTLSEQQDEKTEEINFDALHTAKKHDLFLIAHNFTMLMKLMQTEHNKPLHSQRFIEFTEDDTTGLQNKRFDFLLKCNGQLYPAYIARYQRKIVWGMLPEVLESAQNYSVAIPFLVKLAKEDIETLTQMIQKTAPSFKIIEDYKDKALIDCVAKEFHLS